MSGGGSCGLCPRLIPPRTAPGARRDPRTLGSGIPARRHSWAGVHRTGVGAAQEPPRWSSPTGTGAALGQRACGERGGSTQAHHSLAVGSRGRQAMAWARISGQGSGRVERGPGGGVRERAVSVVVRRAQGGGTEVPVPPRGGLGCPAGGLGAFGFRGQVRAVPFPASLSLLPPFRLGAIAAGGGWEGGGGHACLFLVVLRPSAKGGRGARRGGQSRCKGVRPWL